MMTKVKPHLFVEYYKYRNQFQVGIFLTKHRGYPTERKWKYHIEFGLGTWFVMVWLGVQ